MLRSSKFSFVNFILLRVSFSKLWSTEKVFWLKIRLLGTRNDYF